MRPTTKLLQPKRTTTSKTPSTSAAAISDAILERKRELAEGIVAFERAPATLARSLDGLFDEIRRDSVGRPGPIAMSVVVRVVGATCNDKSIVPLPNLRVTMLLPDKSTLVGRTDVTGLVIFPLPAGAAYQLGVATSTGAELAKASPTPNHTHLISIGEHEGVEPHAILGRGWLVALATAENKKTALGTRIAAALDDVRNTTTHRLRAIDARLAIHLEKRRP